MRNHKAPSSSDTHYTFEGNEQWLIAQCFAVSIVTFAKLVDSVAASNEYQGGCCSEKSGEDVELGGEVDWFPDLSASEQIINGGDAEDSERGDLEAKTSQGDIDAGLRATVGR